MRQEVLIIEEVGYLLETEEIMFPSTVQVVYNTLYYYVYKI